MGKPTPTARSTDRATASKTAAALTAITTMSTAELARKYEEVFGEKTSSKNKGYLKKRIAFRIQELAEGGLSPRAKEKIEELGQALPARWRNAVAAQPAAKPSKVSAAEPETSRDIRLPASGTVLTRKYDGKEHQVTVLDDAFEYAGERYTSLSKIAKSITGTSWNGFLFFGLIGRKGSK